MIAASTTDRAKWTPRNCLHKFEDGEQFNTGENNKPKITSDDGDDEDDDGDENEHDDDVTVVTIIMRLCWSEIVAINFCSL